MQLSSRLEHIRQSRPDYGLGLKLSARKSSTRIISMIKWIRTSRLSIKNSLSLLMCVVYDTFASSAFLRALLLARRIQQAQVLTPIHPKPYTLHPNPYTLHPAPYTVRCVVSLSLTGGGRGSTRRCSCPSLQISPAIPSGFKVKGVGFRVQGVGCRVQCVVCMC